MFLVRWYLRRFRLLLKFWWIWAPMLVLIWYYAVSRNMPAGSQAGLGSLLLIGALIGLAILWRRFMKRLAATPAEHMEPAGPVNLASLLPGERVLLQSRARFEVYSSANAKLRGGFLLFGSPAQLGASLAGGFILKQYIEFQTSQRQWRAAGAGYVAVTTDRLLVSTPEGPAEIPFALIKQVSSGYGGATVELSNREKFKVHADQKEFAQALLRASEGKRWRKLPAETLTATRPVPGIEEDQGKLFRFGVPAGWQHLGDLAARSARLRLPVTAGVSLPMLSRIPPAVVVVAEGTQMETRDVEALAWMLPSASLAATPASQLVGAPRRIWVGGEQGVLYSFRYPLNGTGPAVMTRDTHVVVPRWGTTYRVIFTSEEAEHERYLPDFLAMLATWRWS